MVIDLSIVDAVLIDVDGLGAHSLSQTVPPVAISLVAWHAICRHVKIQRLQRSSDIGILLQVRVPALGTFTRFLRRGPLLQILINHFNLHSNLIMALYIISFLIHLLILL